MLRQIRYCSHSLIDVFYPNLCHICQSNLNFNEQFLCFSCRYELPYFSIHTDLHEKLQKRFWGRVDVAYVFSLLNYQKGNHTQKLLQGIKYQNKQKMGYHLGTVLGTAIPKEYKVDGVIPVPLHPKKERLRGYNQSLVIANGVSRVLGAPVVTDLLKRDVSNASQTKFSKYDRWDNVRDVFSLKRTKNHSGKHFLIVDDVLTTGATLEACARQLLKVTDCTVSIATLAARI